MASKSRYAPFWEKLKANKVLAVRSPEAGFATLIKAIKKRKDQDKAFKLANIIDPPRLVILPKPKDGIVIFMLRQTLGISSIVVPEEIDKMLDTITVEDI